MLHDAAGRSTRPNRTTGPAIARPLRTSERRTALAIGDTMAAGAAVLLALWTWTLTAGFPFDAAFVRAHAAWMLTVPPWVVGLIPTREARVALDLRQTARGIARVAGALLLLYVTIFFWFGGTDAASRAPLLWDATLLIFGWRVAAL